MSIFSIHEYEYEYIFYTMSMSMSIFSIHEYEYEYIFYTLLTPTHSNHELPCFAYRPTRYRFTYS